MAEYELGDYGQAVAHIQKGESIGLADRPAFVAAARYRAALACLRLSDFALALEQLRPLVRAGNDSAPVMEALGLSALNLPLSPAALPADQRPVVELAGRAAWAFVAERPEQAGPLFERLVNLFPLSPGVHYMRGAYLIASDPAAAEEEFRAELRISPSHVLSRVQLALLLIKRGDMENAVKLAREAARLAPGDALSQVTLGRALLSAGETAEAIAALRTGEKLAPLNARTHFYLQQAYQRAGRDADARREQAEFNRLRDQQEPATLREP
jgi:predicted Zn-dependent protease